MLNIKRCVLNTNLKVIKRRLESIKDSLDEYEYWNAQNNNDFLELVKEDIRFHYKVIKDIIEKISIAHD